jgi:hypothetical protein
MSSDTTDSLCKRRDDLKERLRYLALLKSQGRDGSLITGDFPCSVNWEEMRTFRELCSVQKRLDRALR